MYLEHFGLKEAPFRITPHTDFFFEGANRGATLEALLYAITHDEGIVKVSGEVGSGKTMLCRVLMERLPENVETIHLANPSLSRDEILFTLADELQVNLATNRVSAVMRALQEHLIDLYAQGRQVVVLIDEAHAMPAETLEEIRLLSNLESNRHKLLQIVLFGQPELNEVLGRTEMRQLKERITHNFTLEPLVRADVAQYINFRMRAAGYRGPDVFSPAALKLIAGASLGLTRRINILCDKALLAAFAGNTHQITAAHVKAAIRDAEFRGSVMPRLGLWLGGAAAALLLVGGGLAYYQFGEPAQEARPAAPAPPVAPVQAAPMPPQASPASASPPMASAEPAGAPAPTAPVPAAETKPEPAAATTGSAPDQNPAAPPARESGFGPLTRQHIEKTKKWLEATNDRQWFIQLLSTDAGSAGQVERFIAGASRAADADAVRVYTAESKGTRRLGVIYGEYPSRDAASKAIAGLPATLKTYGPYPRQVRRLRN
ncbi:MAG: AAA family ATPase [Denitratisoma sp.]|nr:AAA family ATPase [Denitratisoma sp.]